MCISVCPSLAGGALLNTVTRCHSHMPGEEEMLIKIVPKKKEIKKRLYLTYLLCFFHFCFLSFFGETVAQKENIAVATTYFLCIKSQLDQVVSLGRKCEVRRTFGGLLYSP